LAPDALAQRFQQILPQSRHLDVDTRTVAAMEMGKQMLASAKADFDLEKHPTTMQVWRVRGAELILDPLAGLSNTVHSCTLMRKVGMDVWRVRWK
jgi:hypothetical protein